VNWAALLERATLGQRAQDEAIDKQAAEEEERDDAEDREVALLPEADLPLTDEHFEIRMEDKTLIIQPRETRF
jgi:hypothetical protein